MIPRKGCLSSVRSQQVVLCGLPGGEQVVRHSHVGLLQGPTEGKKAVADGREYILELFLWRRDEDPEALGHRSPPLDDGLAGNRRFRSISRRRTPPSVRF